MYTEHTHLVRVPHDPVHDPWLLLRLLLPPRRQDRREGGLQRGAEPVRRAGQQKDERLPAGEPGAGIVALYGGGRM